MKKLVALLLCVMMVMTLASTAFAADDLPKDVTVRVYSWWDPAKDGMVKLKEGFEAKYADYNVKIEYVKIGSYYKTMLTKLAGLKLAGGKGEAIDVMMIAFDKIPQFASTGTLLALDEYASEEYLNSLYPSVRDGLYFEGNLYATARDITSTCVILNTALFEKCGIALPSEDWTMDDFIALCKEFAKHEGVWGHAVNGYSDTLSPWIYLYGGKYFDEVNNISLLDQPAQLKGFTELYHLMEEGACMSVAQANEFGGISSAFASGHVAMLMGALSLADEVGGKTEDFTVLPLPSGVDGKKASHTFPNCWAVPSVSTQPAWAWKVIEYFSSVEGQTIACNAQMGLPATPDADISEWVAAKPWRKYYVEALSYEGTAPYETDTYGPAWSSNFVTLFNERVWDVRGMDDATLEKTIDEINDLLTYYLLGGS